VDSWLVECCSMAHHQTHLLTNRLLAAGRNRPAESQAPEGSRHAAAMVQLLSVVEGLEEELFAAEAACHEAEVEAAAAVRHSAVSDPSLHLLAPSAIPVAAGLSHSRDGGFGIALTTLQ
jgi:hypothetical protein